MTQTLPLADRTDLSTLDFEHLLTVSAVKGVAFGRVTPEHFARGAAFVAPNNPSLAVLVVLDVNNPRPFSLHLIERTRKSEAAAERWTRVGPTSVAKAYELLGLEFQS